MRPTQRTLDLREPWRGNTSNNNTLIGTLPSIKPPEPLKLITTGTTTKSDGEKKSLPFRKLNWKEQKERRAQGLCFNCDEKFSATKDYKGRFLMFVVGDDENGGQLNNPYQLEANEHEMVLLIDVSSLHSLAGQNKP